MKIEAMVKEFQCAGCVVGHNTKCGKYDPQPMNNGTSCKSWVAGTTILPAVGRIALGLPKGFNRFGEGKLYIRLHQGTTPDWNKFNVPVWAMEKDGFLFVRTYSPRVNATIVDVIEGGTFDLFKERRESVVDVGAFINEID